MPKESGRHWNRYTQLLFSFQGVDEVRISLYFAFATLGAHNVSPDFLLLRASEQPIYLRARSLSTHTLQLERIPEHNILQNGKVIPISSVIPPKVAANTSSNAHDVVVVEILGEQ